MDSSDDTDTHPFENTETYPFEDADPSGDADLSGDTDTAQDSGTSSGPEPDFSTLQAAATTYRMLGATPVPLFNGARSESAAETGGPNSPGTDYFTGPGWLYGIGEAQSEGKTDWQKADGIGLVAGRGGWHGLLVRPIELRSAIHDLRVRDTAWVARNDDSALIYFRTDANRAILRALASIFRASKRPRFTIASDVDVFGGPDGPTVLPVPPSEDLVGGEWEFPKGKPQTPPPYRTFEVGAEIRSEGRPEEPGQKNQGTSKSIPSLGRKRNYETQTHQSQRKSKWSLPTRDTLSF